MLSWVHMGTHPKDCQSLLTLISTADASFLLSLTACRNHVLDGCKKHHCKFPVVSNK